MSNEAQDYVDAMAEKRGYVLDYHKIMAAADFPVLQAANHVVNSAYLEERTLDRKTKELLFVLSLTVMRAPLPQLRSHIQVALDLGLSPQEILEAIEIALPEAGIVAFQYGVEAWQSVVNVDPLEPRVKVHSGKAE
ncbi:carboxymuconolactone decarboxylase family protein [Citricoccus sp. NPDC055426]|uniref:carboxymuconolactone decarboxylase family protein n=1 Tax=Citricoccus sp. NPDC055426 TaxID=3155536 RepID=UPI00341670F9